jgi:hypothetical protein
VHHGIVPKAEAFDLPIEERLKRFKKNAKFGKSELQTATLRGRAGKAVSQ